jgi:uncharacterized MAPEG superfamily protein
MEKVAIVTAILLLQYFVFMMLVGVARGKSGVQAPAITGDPVFERTLRVQQNTLEQLLIVLPAMWLFATYFGEDIAAGLGVAFFVGRVLYYRGYVADPGKRSIGFGIGLLATLALLLGALGGAVTAIL